MTCLEALCRPGISDVMQLRVALCSVLQRAVADNGANKLAARECGAFPPLLTLLGAPLRPAEGPRYLSYDVIIHHQQ